MACPVTPATSRRDLVAALQLCGAGWHPAADWQSALAQRLEFVALMLALRTEGAPCPKSSEDRSGSGVTLSRDRQGAVLDKAEWSPCCEHNNFHFFAFLPACCWNFSPSARISTGSLSGWRSTLTAQPRISNGKPHMI